MDLVLPFDQIGADALARVGGKAVNLARLAALGFPVPPGVCVTTEAFRRFMVAPELDELLAQLDTLALAELDRVRELGEALRQQVRARPIPAEIEQAIVAAWTQLGPEHAYAVRSSATAEDLPSASFAGQQDTYLNVIGRAAVLERVRDCWASLYTDRAILYRAKQGFDHRRVQLAVVIQRMLRPRSSGILFTAHPLDGRRHVASIEAGFGLGEALVSGLVNPDLYEVDKREQTILRKLVGDKRIAIVPLERGGTQEIELDEDRRHAQALDDAQILALAQLGARIEASFGGPQDIEWCYEDGQLFVTQTRAITTLFPIPERWSGLVDTPPDLAADPGLRLFISLGHLQVMTDVMSPFAHGVWRRFVPFIRDPHGRSRIVCSGGGRLFIDPTDLFRLPRIGPKLARALALGDAAISAAAAAVLARPSFRAAKRQIGRFQLLRGASFYLRRIVPRVLWRAFFARTHDHAERTRARLDAELERLRAQLQAQPDLRLRLREQIEGLSRVFVTYILPIAPSILAAGLATLIVRKLTAGRASEADLQAIRSGLRGNVTTMMDLEIGDLADLVRESPSLSAYLRAQERPSLAELAQREDAGPLLAALERFLAEYGMRGGSEIDISRPRWIDDPTPLLQVIRGNLSHEQPGSHRAHHQRMQSEGEAAAARLIAAAKWWARPLVRRLVHAARNLMAIREHPKFQIVRLLALLRADLLRYADELVAAGKLARREDIWWIDSEELLAALDHDTEHELARIAVERRAAWQRFTQLTPPRVITSEGEILSGLGARGARRRVALHHGLLAPRDDLPPGALHGVGAAAGVVEGPVRIVLDPHRDVLHAGEILVAPFTDPGWTPLFINAAGLIMEVGGLMTHGSVVAREYGIPAVVSVEGATTRLRNGQRVRIDGTRGVIELL